jgi:ribosome-associated toxin RatA of RatAB toxin-antitoxin module
MKHVKRSVLLWYGPSEMYSLVTAVQHYPQFLPWCESAQVLEQHADGVTARLGLAVLGLRQHFTTRNVHVADTSVQLKLLDGPFSMLEGRWDFHPLSAPGWAASPAAQGAAAPRACRTELNLRYAFSSGALQSVVGPAFDRIADTLVDSFVKRAEVVYGARAG